MGQAAYGRTHAGERRKRARRGSSAALEAFEALSLNGTVVANPEPASSGLIIVGGMGILLRRRRQLCL